MPNQRRKGIKRCTITLPSGMWDMAMDEAERMGIFDFSSFVRTILADHLGRRTNKKERDQHGKK